MLAGESGAITIKKLFVWLVVAFIIVSVWRDPRGASQEIGGFLGDVGHFLTIALMKLSEALQGVFGA